MMHAEPQAVLARGGYQQVHRGPPGPYRPQTNRAAITTDPPANDASPTVVAAHHRGHRSKSRRRPLTPDRDQREPSASASRGHSPATPSALTEGREGLIGDVLEVWRGCPDAAPPHGGGLGLMRGSSYLLN
jgi:hypothetical protein